MDIQEQLDRDEHMLWHGRPPRGLVLRTADILLIPFSLLWTGFAIVWTLLALGFAPINPEGKHISAPLPFVALGSMFVLAGLFFTFGRFFADAYRRVRTEYAVTDSRALILSGWFGRSLNSMPLTPSVQIEVSGQNRGSIKIGQGYGFLAFNRGWGAWMGPGHPFMFERIAEVRRVYQIIRDVQQGRR